MTEWMPSTQFRHTPRGWNIKPSSRIEEQHKRKKGISKVNKKDRRILSELAARLRQRYTDARVWAYGSRAKGTADWDSDFDICIVLDKVTHEKERFIRDIAWEIGFENDRVITTFIIDQEDFEHGPMSESSLVANILSQGVPA